jgi:hypothetical protein
MFIFYLIALLTAAQGFQTPIIHSSLRNIVHMLRGLVGRTSSIDRAYDRCFGLRGCAL